MLHLRCVVFVLAIADVKESVVCVCVCGGGGTTAHSLATTPDKRDLHGVHHEHNNVVFTTDDVGTLSLWGMSGKHPQHAALPQECCHIITESVCSEPCVQKKIRETERERERERETSAQRIHDTAERIDGRVCPVVYKYMRSQKKIKPRIIETKIKTWVESCF